MVNLMNNQYMRENEVCVCVFFNLLNGLVDLDLLLFLDLWKNILNICIIWKGYLLGLLGVMWRSKKILNFHGKIQFWFIKSWWSCAWYMIFHKKVACFFYCFLVRLIYQMQPKWAFLFIQEFGDLNLESLCCICCFAFECSSFCFWQKARTWALAC